MLATGVVDELVFANATDGKVVGFGVCDHQAADAGMRLHGAMLGKADADGGEIDEVVEVEVEALIGQAGIAHGRTDALETLGVKIRDAEVLIRSISPVELTDGLMCTFYGRFSQAVGKCLT